jgi:acetyl esterase/lipase
MISPILITTFMLVQITSGAELVNVRIVRAPAEIEKASDIAYLPNPNESEYAEAQCKLDVFYPKGVKDFPTIVFFHGGGLRGGERQWGDIVAERFVPEGIAVVTVSYRFSPKVKHPVYIEDAAASVAWTIKNIEEYGGNPDKIFISGHSAGGYLALMVGMDPRYLEKHGIEMDRLAGLMPISGQTITHSTIRRERGIAEGTQHVDEYAPLYYAHKAPLPSLCIAGSDDLPLRGAENEYLVEVQQSAGNDNVTYLEVAKRDHDTIYSYINKPGDEVASAMLAFMHKTMSAED